MKLIFPMKTFRAVMPTILPFLALVALCSATYAEPSELAAPTDVGGTTPPTIRRASSADTTNSPSATITLSDGSVVKGVLCDETLPAVSDNLGDICLNLDIVKTIEFDRKKQGKSGDHNRQTPRCRIVFSNGDLLSVRIPEQIQTLKINTLVGTLSIPLESIASVMIARHATGGLIYHCTFDDAQSIVHPAVGPNGRFLGGEFVPGKVVKALRVFADEPAAEVDFKPGFLGVRGTIEFWAKMEEATKEAFFGDGGNPRFFCLWIADDINRPGQNPRSSYLQWSGNDGGGRSGLCAMLPGATATTETGCGVRRYPSFLGNPATWHHYAVVWDENGVDGSNAVLSIYVDGMRISAGGHNELFRGKNFRRFLESAVLLGFPQRKSDKEPAARHVPFLIDEFKIWSEPKTDIGLP